MTPKEQMDQITAQSNASVNTAIRQVQGGYVVTGQIQYADKDTGGILASMQAEGVAASAEQACSMSLNYHRSGRFESPQLSLDGLGTGTGLAGAANTGQPPLV